MRTQSPLGLLLHAFLAATALGQQNAAPTANGTQNGTNDTNATNATSAAANPLLALFQRNQFYFQNFTPFQTNTTNNKSLPDVPIPPWDPEHDVSGSMRGNSPIQNPLNCPPEAYIATQMNMTLRNYDRDILDILFLRSYQFNNSLNGTELMSLNNRIYAFSWRNGVFERLPFPVNSTFPYNTTDTPEQPIVLTPLKNRFAPRPINKRQMDCALHARVLEANHYVGKFNRIIMQFFSPCMDYPVLRYFVNKAGLRASLDLRLLNRRYLFQFAGSYSAQFGQSQTEAYRRYRLLQPHHHAATFKMPKYKVDNRTNASFSVILNNKTMTPESMFALQMAAIDRIERNYRHRIELFDQQDQTRDWKTRNERMPRKAAATDDREPADSAKSKEDLKKERKQRREMREMIKKFEKEHAHVKSRPFNMTDKQRKKNLETVTKFLGSKENTERFLQQFGDLGGFQGSRVWDSSADSVYPRHPGHPYHNGNDREPWWTWHDQRFQGFARNFYGLGSHTFYHSVYPTVWHIRRQEMYKIHVCQRICRTGRYYHSWNFCLRVCGVNYNFLSNLRNPFAPVNLFPNVPYMRVASQLVFLNSKRRSGRQFSYDEIKSFWDKPQVLGCRQSWSRFTCRL